MEKLQLKHLAPYLPYKLKCKVTDSGTKLKAFEIAELYAIYSNRECAFHDLVESCQGFYSVYPILRPLSDLTKEIEINGSKFLPMYELFECSIEEKERFEIYGEMPTYWRFMLSVSIPNGWEYMNVNMLFKWHFDVFGLINKGLAIDLNTMT